MSTVSASPARERIEPARDRGAVWQARNSPAFQ